MENDNAVPAGALALGVNVYKLPTVTDVGGLPEIVGAVVGAVTVMLNAARDDEETPSLTLMMMFENVPTFDVVGVPESCPVDVLKLAQTGCPEIEKVSVYPLGPLAVGVKLYACPTTSLVAGVPEMTGAGNRHLFLALAPPAMRSAARAHSKTWRGCAARWRLMAGMQLTPDQ